MKTICCRCRTKLRVTDKNEIREIDFGGRRRWVHWKCVILTRDAWDLARLSQTRKSDSLFYII